MSNSKGRMFTAKERNFIGELQNEFFGQMPDHTAVANWALKMLCEYMNTNKPISWLHGQQIPDKIPAEVSDALCGIRSGLGMADEAFFEIMRTIYGELDESMQPALVHSVASCSSLSADRVQKFMTDPGNCRPLAPIKRMAFIGTVVEKAQKLQAV